MGRELLVSGCWYGSGCLLATGSSPTVGYGIHVTFVVGGSAERRLFASVGASDATSEYMLRMRLKCLSRT